MSIRSLVFGVLLCVTTASSQAQVVRVGVWPDSVAVGQLFEYRISVDYGGAYSGFIPPDSTGWGDAFEYRGMRRVAAGAGRDSVVIRLQFFGTADTLIAPRSVRLTGPDTLTLLTPALPVYFKSLVEADGAELRPLKPIFDFARNWWPWIIGAIVLAAIAYVLVDRYRKRPAPPDPAPVVERPPFIDPLESLRRELETLKRSDLVAQGDFKGWYSELGDHLRRYIEDVHGIPAMESTTAELRAAFRQRGLHSDLAKPMLAVMESADLVKFAKSKPTAADADASYETARTFADAAERLDRLRILHLEQEHRRTDDPA